MRVHRGLYPVTKKQIRTGNSNLRARPLSLSDVPHTLAACCGITVPHGRPSIIAKVLSSALYSSAVRERRRICQAGEPRLWSPVLARSEFQAGRHGESREDEGVSFPGRLLWRTRRSFSVGAPHSISMVISICVPVPRR